MHCEAPASPGDAGWGQPRLAVGDIFRTHGEAYRRSHALSDQQRKVMHAIEVCRTPVLGGRMEVCDRCGHQQVQFNSCRNRHCPMCQSLKQHSWLESRMERLLPTDYFHVVFTIPDRLLNPIVERNRQLLFDLMFEAASRCLLELGEDRNRLGAQLGATLVLHTWTRDLLFHPHLHCIVTGGGLSLDGNRWVAARQNYLFPVKVLSKLFRGKLIAALDRAYRAGRLSLSGSCAELSNPKAFARLKDRLYKAAWVSYAKKPFAGPSQVFSYLGLYTHRVGISNHRLLAVDSEGVLFRTRGEKTARLKPQEFIRRFLQHVLPAGFVKIRHYGLLAPANVNTRLARARTLLEAKTPRLPAAVAAAAALLLAIRPSSDQAPAAGDWRARLQRVAGIDASACPACGIGRLITSPLQRLALPNPRPKDSS